MVVEKEMMKRFYLRSVQNYLSFLIDQLALLRMILDSQVSVHTKQC